MPAPRPVPVVLDAEADLARRDPVLAGIIATSGPCALGRRGYPSHFEALCRSIVFQQLAGRAAQAIWLRFRALVPGSLTADAVLSVDEAALRAAGLSGAKARSITDLAAHVADGRVHLQRTARMSDDEIVGELTQVWGIGPWTAQMFLMFQLARLDVWPILDFGVRNGFARLYGHAEMPTAKELEPLGEQFRPYRSIAAWYCWRAVDVITI
jgi:3-methyladenine DNA glycosylase/8-oxoguanine DNA glycosylase